VSAKAAIPPWVARVLGPDVTEQRQLAWGFTNEAWAGRTADGELLVAARMADPGSARAIIERGPAIAERLAAAGIETPVPLAARSDPGLGVVVSRVMEGTPGIELLHGRGAAAVGRALGGVWRRLSAVDPSGLGLDGLWARPEELAAAAYRWLGAVEAELPPAALRVAQSRLQRLGGLLGGRRPGLVHGDLVPANVLMRDPGPAALLDLEAVHLGEPLLDAAWFEWIVRYHHPAIVPAAWESFAAAGGIRVGDAATAGLLEVLPTARILEILAGLAAGPARIRWLEQLRMNLASMSDWKRPDPHALR
jgi:aminoglycoside phosphotransferase (APT) family kinase protein